MKPSLRSYGVIRIVNRSRSRRRYRDGGEVCLDDCGVARDKVIELGCGGSQPTLSAALAACGVKLFPKLKSARTQPLVFAYPIIPF
jgi:hypothetical protein